MAANPLTQAVQHMHEQRLDIMAFFDILLAADVLLAYTNDLSKHNNPIPLVFDQDGQAMAAIFSEPEFAADFAEHYHGVIAVPAQSLIIDGRADLGLVLNPGHEFGFAINADTLAAIRGMLKAQ